MASSMAAMTMPRSIDFSRATASAICSSSSLLALTAIESFSLVLGRGPDISGRAAGFLVGTGVSITARVAQLALRFALAFASFALLGLGAVERFGHQRVGEDELGLRHVGDRMQAASSCAPRSIPRNRLRPSTGAVISAFTTWPA